MVKNIANLEVDIVKTGMGGADGNKGSCFLRFSYLDTSIAIACAHLSAGQKHTKQRIEELTDIINKPLVVPTKNEPIVIIMLIIYRKLK